jgi:hypothetical protein
MSNLTHREVANITPVQALFVTALLAVSGASEGTRRIATHLFERSAVSAVWAFLGRHSDARVSWLRLVSITYEATRRFLHAWPASGAMTIESMMTTLETCTSAVASRVADTTRPTLSQFPLGVLTLLPHDERLQLLQCVQGAITPAHLCVLHATVESERADAHSPHTSGADVVSAIDQLESRLLGACIYTLGAPEEFRHGRLAS